MKKITWLSAVLCCALLLLMGCNQTTSKDEAENTREAGAKITNEDEMSQLLEEKDTQISTLLNEKEELQQSLESSELDLKYSKEEAEYYKQFLNSLIKDYSDEQKQELAKDLWEYELKVNGVAVSEDGEVHTKDKTIEISIIQEQSAYPILPNDEFVKGKISGRYNEHISGFSEEPNETYGTDGTVVTGTHFKFNNLSADQR